QRQFFHNYPQQTVILTDLLEVLTAVIVPLFAPVRQNIPRREANFFASETLNYALFNIACAISCTKLIH
ncbi:hypothetical protein ACS0TW_39775, partial [Klebsiella michiganensis]